MPRTAQQLSNRIATEFLGNRGEQDCSCYILFALQRWKVLTMQFIYSNRTMVEQKGDQLSRSKVKAPVNFNVIHKEHQEISNKKGGIRRGCVVSPTVLSAAKIVSCVRRRKERKFLMLWNVWRPHIQQRCSLWKMLPQSTKWMNETTIQK